MSTLTDARAEFLQRLRDALVQAINGNPITIADAWDILREWDRALTIAETARRFEMGEATSADLFASIKRDEQ